MRHARVRTMPPAGRIPTPWIRDCLSPLLAERRPGLGILDIQRSPAPYRSSWWLEDLALTLDDGTVCRLVMKDLSTPAAGSDATRVKPRAVLDFQREPWVYRTLLSPAFEGPPACWGTGSRGGRAGTCLFLEQVHGVPLSEVGNFDAWLSAAAWLGSFHARIRGRIPSQGPLIRHDEGLHRWWFQRAVARQGAGALLELEAAHQRAVREVLRGEPTVIHGEYYPSNVLVEREEGRCRIRPVDWEMAGLGPAAWDLAALVSGEWSVKDRLEMTLAYRRAAEAAGPFSVPLEGLLRDVTACRLLLAVQWMGWSSDWDPPEEHRNNWLEEARSCAEEL